MNSNQIIIFSNMQVVKRMELQPIENKIFPKFPLRWDCPAMTDMMILAKVVEYMMMVTRARYPMETVITLFTFIFINVYSLSVHFFFTEGS